MRRLLTLLLILIALPAQAALFDKRAPSAPLGAPLNNSGDFLPVREAFRLSLVEHKPESIKVRFVAAEGYYLYRHRFQFSSVPNTVSLGAAKLPAGEAKNDEFFGDVEVYRQVLDIEVPLNNPDGSAFTLKVGYQGCADKGLCYPPETEVFELTAPGSATAPVTLGPNAAAAPPAVGAAPAWSWHELALFFLAGLGLAFTPCVLPMLPILSGVVLRGQAGGWRGFSLATAYVVPMAGCFALLGALMGVFGAELNLQARLQSAWILVPFALVFALFALAMFGLFEVRLPRLISDRLDRLAGNARGGSLWGAA